MGFYKFLFSLLTSLSKRLVRMLSLYFRDQNVYCQSLTDVVASEVVFSLQAGALKHETIDRGTTLFIGCVAFYAACVNTVGENIYVIVASEFTRERI